MCFVKSTSFEFIKNDKIINSYDLNNIEVILMVFKCHSNDFYITFAIYIASNISHKQTFDIVVNSENECILDDKIL